MSQYFLESSLEECRARCAGFNCVGFDWPRRQQAPEKLPFVQRVLVTQGLATGDHLQLNSKPHNKQ